MNKLRIILLTLFLLAGCKPVTEPPIVKTIDEIIELEMRASFDFFWEQANTTKDSPGYGLVADRYPGSAGVASMASVGYALTAYIIGVEKGYITMAEGYDRVDKTFDTLLKMEDTQGFYFHFVDMTSGVRVWDSEVSVIDSGILMMGVLSAGDYFGLAEDATELYERVNWNWYVDQNNHQFYMSYKPGAGFAGHWDFYAEQLILYVLGAGSPTHPTGLNEYNSFIRDVKPYGEGDPFIHSWFGSIFTYQFSHAWIDFKGTKDTNGVNWFENSVAASQAHYDYAVKVDAQRKTIGPDAWGLTASDGPGGYNGLYGAPPSGFDNNQHKVDDTVAPSGAIGSIIFLPEEAKKAMLNYYNVQKLFGKYGFVDAYNLTKNWKATDVIGIDKGITLLMLANYQDDIVYNVSMNNKVIIEGLKNLNIKKVE
ncbi:MAG: hypothetical protein FD179_25 [Erysipelotrichaceae bacterium]|nr:MAG: hypothetical protein FD179_25 [Erysipelotrichaceae bacterium]